MQVTIDQQFEAINQQIWASDNRDIVNVEQSTLFGELLLQ